MSNSFSALESAVVAICDANSRIVGTGFLVEGDLILTCAHVIEDAGSGPDGTVQVIFRDEHDLRSARVMSEWWSSPATDDVAVLRLEGSLPSDAIPLTLGYTRACHGHALRILGFPELPGGYEMAYAEGQIRGVVPHPDKQPMLQMDAQPIRRGMSGAPVLDLVTQRIVGMVSEYALNMPLEWATTSETLQHICPAVTLDLPHPVKEHLKEVRDKTQAVRTYRRVQKGKNPLSEIIPLKVSRILGSAEQESLGATDKLAITLQEAVNKHSRVILSGEPGSGKSILMRQLAKYWVERCQQKAQADLKNVYLPIMVSLRDLPGQAPSLESYLSNNLRLPNNLRTDWASQTGATWLLILDGLDEIVGVHNRENLIIELNASWTSEMHIVITTRPDEVVDLAENFAFYQLEPPDEEQVRQLIEPWLAAADWSLFWEALQSTLLAEIKTPLFYVIAAKIFRDAQLIGTSNSKTFFTGFSYAGLYERFVILVLNEDKEREMLEQFRLRFGVLGEALFFNRRSALECIAAAIQKSTDIHESLPVCLSRSPICDADLSNLKDPERIMQILAHGRSDLVVEENEEYRFIHPSIREYLAACAILRESEFGAQGESVEERVITNLADARWQLTVLFALGRLSEQNPVGADELINKILDTAGDKALYLVSEFIIQQQHVDSQIIERVVKGLEHEAQTRKSTRSAVKPSPVSYLGKLSRALDSGARESLKILATQRQVSPAVLEEIAETFERIGQKDNAISTWENISRDETARASARQRAETHALRLRRDAVFDGIDPDIRETTLVLSHLRRFDIASMREIIPKVLSNNAFEDYGPKQYLDLIRRLGVLLYWREQGGYALLQVLRHALQRYVLLENPRLYEQVHKTAIVYYRNALVQSYREYYFPELLYHRLMVLKFDELSELKIRTELSNEVLNHIKKDILMSEELDSLQDSLLKDLDVQDYISEQVFTEIQKRIGAHFSDRSS